MVGRRGKVQILFEYYNIDQGVFTLSLKLRLEDDAREAWRRQAWATAREAHKNQHYESREFLRDRRAKLIEELGRFDALTLRRMEQEEVMKSVLRWLMGPAFDFVPVSVQNLFKDPDDSGPQKLQEIQADNDEKWASVLMFGEFVKFLHQAIEWENVLYFPYPVLLGLSQNLPSSFFYHPDPVHRAFLRAGSARVGPTIRPGFEESFTRLMDAGLAAAVGTPQPDPRSPRRWRPLRGPTTPPCHRQTQWTTEGRCFCQSSRGHGARCRS